MVKFYHNKKFSVKFLTVITPWRNIQTKWLKNMAKKLGSGSLLTKEILLKLAQVGCFIVATSSPYFGHYVVQKYFNDKIKTLAQKRARKLKELQNKNLINFLELPDGSIKIELSHLGKNFIRHYKLEELKINKPRKWDKKWRLVIYDIPHQNKKARDAFRKKIKDLGLYRLQKSVWVSPYDCLAEIEFLCTVFDIDINRNIIYFETPKLPNEQDLKKRIGLS